MPDFTRYFNSTEYTEAKAAQLNSLAVDNRTDWSADDVSQLFASIGLSAEEYYTIYGARELDASGHLVNPSNAFDANAYAVALLKALTMTDPATWAGKTALDVVTSIADTGVSLLVHYANDGAALANATGITMAQTVPVSMRVANDPDRTVNVPANYNKPVAALADITADTATATAKPCDMGSLLPLGNYDLELIATPEDEVATPYDEDYVPVPGGGIEDTYDNPVVLVRQVMTDSNGNVTASIAQYGVQVTAGAATIVLPVDANGTVLYDANPIQTTTVIDGQVRTETVLYTPDGEEVTQVVVDGEVVEPEPEPEPQPQPGGGGTTPTRPISVSIPSFVESQLSSKGAISFTGNPGEVWVSNSRYTSDNEIQITHDDGSFIYIGSTGGLVSDLGTLTIESGDGTYFPVYTVNSNIEDKQTGHETFYFYAKDGNNRLYETSASVSVSDAKPIFAARDASAVVACSDTSTAIPFGTVDFGRDEPTAASGAANPCVVSSIVGSHGATYSGSIVYTAADKTITFTPGQVWAAGTYKVTVKATDSDTTEVSHVFTLTAKELFAVSRQDTLQFTSDIPVYQNKEYTMTFTGNGTCTITHTDKTAFSETASGISTISTQKMGKDLTIINDGAGLQSYNGGKLMIDTHKNVHITLNDGKDNVEIIRRAPGNKIDITVNGDDSANVDGDRDILGGLQLGDIIRITGKSFIGASENVGGDGTSGLTITRGNMNADQLFTPDNTGYDYLIEWNDTTSHAIILDNNAYIGLTGVTISGDTLTLQ